MALTALVTSVALGHWVLVMPSPPPLTDRDETLSTVGDGAIVQHYGAKEGRTRNGVLLHRRCYCRQSLVGGDLKVQDLLSTIDFGGLGDHTEG